ncbi:MAG TPA: PAS domain-containing protein [Symbiobacteriaceae bacterium]|jgi:predicted transcriptional regulator YheO
MLRSLIPVAKMLAQTFGPECEVVLHDLSRPQASRVLIENAEVTGRQVGTPIGDLVVRVLRSPRFRDDMLANYATTAPDGRTLKSSTAIIRDEAGRAIGALCLNLDLSGYARAAAALQMLVRLEDAAAPDDREVDVPDEHVWDVLDRIVTQVISGYGPSGELDRSQKLEVVRFLHEKGVFLIKGGIEHVARKLGVSRFSIYNYIDEVRGTSRTRAQQEGKA